MTDIQALQDLAIECGVQTGYVDSTGTSHASSPEALLSVLQALDVPIRDTGGAWDALREMRERQRKQVCPPVLVAWQGNLRPFPGEALLRDRENSHEVCIDLESGEQLHGLLQPVGDGSQLQQIQLHPSAPLPLGIHSVRIESSQSSPPGKATIISSPESCFGSGPDATRDLGVFMPLHALHDALTWGVGDFRALEELQRWASSLGCTRVATLPLLACFLDEPFDPSPYLPVSRLYWNELFLDLSSPLDAEHSAPARALLSSQALAAGVRTLQNTDHVDYRAVAGLKSKVLQLLSAEAFARPERRREMEELLKSDPLLDRYARFRAVTETRGTAWLESSEGTGLPFTDRELPAWRRHVYAQFLLREQLGRLATLSPTGSLALDLPIGVHPSGFDAWQWREEFVAGVSAGAPPDLFFAQGQNWAFRPPHPGRTRATGHHYFLRAITNHMAPAGLLRVDHVMSLHRLFWIPQGFPASQGVYVRYPSEELYALLCLASHRCKARVVGENLGTVPPEVGIDMKRRGLLSTTVAQFDLHADPRAPIALPPQQSLATINTHDTPPWKAYWSGSDVALRCSLGLLDDPEGPLWERGNLRQAVASYFGLPSSPSDEAASEALESLLRDLAAGPALEVLINLEDLWLEDRPQNVPGVQTYPAWTRKAALSLEEIQGTRRISELLRELGTLRRNSPQQHREEP